MWRIAAAIWAQSISTALKEKCFIDVDTQSGVRNSEWWGKCMECCHAVNVTSPELATLPGCAEAGFFCSPCAVTAT